MSLDFLDKYRRDYFSSQNGEEGVLLEACRRLNLTNGHTVEIGGHDGLYCSNTALLIRNHGWSGVFVEADYALYEKSLANWASYPRARSICSYVDTRNVDAFITSECDLLSLDTDGGDYGIFCAMTARPKIVIVEIDSSIEPPDDEFNSDGGASYWKMVIAGLERGYLLLCHTGNLIFVRQEYGKLFPECAPHPLLEWECYFNRKWL